MVLYVHRNHKAYQGQAKVGEERLITAVSFIARYVTNKGEHTTLYTVNKKYR